MSATAKQSVLQLIKDIEDKLSYLQDKEIVQRWYHSMQRQTETQGDWERAYQILKPFKDLPSTVVSTDLPRRLTLQRRSLTCCIVSIRQQRLPRYPR
jgi:hypothetical protein